MDLVLGGVLLAIGMVWLAAWGVRALESATTPTGLPRTQVLPDPFAVKGVLFTPNGSALPEIGGLPMPCLGEDR